MEKLTLGFKSYLQKQQNRKNYRVCMSRGETVSGCDMLGCGRVYGRLLLTCACCTTDNNCLIMLMLWILQLYGIKGQIVQVFEGAFWYVSLKIYCPQR